MMTYALFTIFFKSVAFHILLKSFVHEGVQCIKCDKKIAVDSL